MVFPDIPAPNDAAFTCDSIFPECDMYINFQVLLSKEIQAVQGEARERLSGENSVQVIRAGTCRQQLRFQNIFSGSSL